jgi:glycerophosphoryl diester phosphodiesterase
VAAGRGARYGFAMSNKRLLLLIVCGTLLFALIAAALAATSASAATAKKSKNSWRQSQPWNIAHQGGEDEAPSNTMYAFKRAAKAGVKMLELDVGVTKDDQVIVMHDTSVDRTSSGTGEISSLTLSEIRKLDNAYWFSRTSGKHYDHNLPQSAYPFRGVATGDRKPPKGYKASDFRITTLSSVLKAFPNIPINVEIKGRTAAEEVDGYLYNARVLAKLLKKQKRRDVVIASFIQEAVNLYHQLDKRLPLAPGVTEAAGFLLSGEPVSEGVAVFQLPVRLGDGPGAMLVADRQYVDKVHAGGYAWHAWFSGTAPDTAETWKQLLKVCVDGIMTSRPVALAKFLDKNRAPSRCKVK